MSLDDFNGTTDEDIVEQFLWGPGHNRWVDKSFSVLITNEGKCGLNFEHAWGDGACVLSFFDKAMGWDFFDFRKSSFVAFQIYNSSPQFVHPQVVRFGKFLQYPTYCVK